MSSEAAKKASRRYNDSHTRQIGLVLNLTTDADILEQLDRQESKLGYIKRLIREDIANRSAT